MKIQGQYLFFKPWNEDGELYYKIILVVSYMIETLYNRSVKLSFYVFILRMLV